MGSCPVVVRTLDIGGDKQVEYLRPAAGIQSFPRLAGDPHDA